MVSSEQLKSNMEVRKEGTVIDVIFNQYGVKIRATRVWEVRKRVTEAEITIYADLPTIGKQQERIERTNVSLLDYSTKRRLIEVLSEKTDDFAQISWGTIINQAFDAIIDLHREGTPAIEMTDLHINESPRSFFVNPFFVKGASNMVYAKGGSGKSMFSLLTCVLVDRGISTAGISAVKGNVIWLDWEEESSVFKNRLYAIQKGLGLTDPEKSGILWKRMDRSLPDEIDEVATIVADIGSPTYLVIDSLSAAIDGSANDDESIKRYFNALRTLGEGTTSVTIDHTNKAGELYGSSMKHNRTRMMHELKKIDTYKNAQGNNVADVAMYWRKGNDAAPSTARGFEVTYLDKVIESEYGNSYTDKVIFRSMNLGESDQVLGELTVAKVCEEIIKSSGSQDLDKLAQRVSIVKDETITSDAIANFVRSTKSLQVNDNGTVGLLYNEGDRNDYTIE